MCLNVESFPLEKKSRSCSVHFLSYFQGIIGPRGPSGKRGTQGSKVFFFSFLSLFCFVFYHNDKIKKILIFIYIVRFCYLKGERGESGNEGENGPTGPKVCDNVANFTLISADEHFFQ